MATVKIQSKTTQSIFEFETLDKALRELHGATENGDRFNQPLLTTPSRRTFKEAHSLLERNGYSIYRDAAGESAEATMPIPQPSHSPGSVPRIKLTPMTEEQLMQILRMGVDVEKSRENAEAYMKMQSELAGIHAKSRQTPDGGVKIEVKTKSKPESKTDTNGWEFMAQQIQKFLDMPQIDQEKLKSELNSSVNEAVTKALETRVKEVIVVRAETGERKNVGRQHFQFEVLLQCISARVNALLVGPAGSGKTTAAHAAANALSIPFYSISVGMQTTKTDFFGYMDATGKYVRTLFRQAFEHGGVFLIDEVDAGNANVITSINQALANGYCAFPDGMITKHEDFVIIASGNTFGTGANREYVGRNQLDAATLDRFAVITWNYDDELESELCPNKDWLRFVRGCRKNADTHKIRTVISPRASILGAQLIAQGIKLAAVKEMLIFKGINPTERAKLLEGGL